MKNLFSVNFSIIALTILSFSIYSCKEKTQTKKYTYKTIPLEKISPEAEKVRDYVKMDVIIAHRGTTFWAPEETEAAFRWGRNMGADYLEIDLQRTKDGFLLALHDNNLQRTTNIEEVYPERKNLPVSEFTLAELRELDAGSWFNTSVPENARERFKNQKISTLEEVLKIAEGYRIKRDANNNPVKLIETFDEIDSATNKKTTITKWRGRYQMEPDLQDNGNRPGVYAETKEPQLFDGIEKELALFLTEKGWNINSPETLKKAPTGDEYKMAYTKGRFILQSFSPESIAKLDTYLPKIPKCMLLWYDDDPAKMPQDSLVKSLANAINYAVKYNCQIIGPSISGPPNNYNNLASPWMCDMYHRAGMLIHAYSFDTEEQLKRYNGDYFYGGISRFENPNRKVNTTNNYKIQRSLFIDGGFTNLTDLSLKYYHRPVDKTAREVLTELGY